ncbi:MAG: vanadium-dependent haloperoxidase, partial [Saprospiraceae bacterium]|nr:vanadium-dependent haloperoxidase [Saprospiraceae bacterium]
CALAQGCTSSREMPEVDVGVLNVWNEQVMKSAIREDGLLTLRGVRTASMMHVAIHDALNAIDPRYAPYAYSGTAQGVHPLAAIAHAAHAVTSSQYPDQSAAFDAILAQQVTDLTDSEVEAGRALGQAAAGTILEMRNGDAWNGEAEYTWHPMAPGVYAEFNEHSGTPEGFIFGAGWARAQPFMLPSQDHFRSPPPPDIASEAYTAAFNEVKEVGAHESATRTADQAHLAMWWKDFVENSHNRLARDLVQQQQPDLWDAARLFALMNMAIYDAYINVFDNKFHYNHWRPYTAIRWAAHDGNENTLADTAWNNLHQHTYAFPSYPSAHGTASAAAMTVLGHTLGTGDTFAFTMRTDSVDRAGPFSGLIAMDPPTRSFNSFSEAAMEASMSRVYLGIHFRYDSEEGFRLGTKIGDYANDNFLEATYNH